ncbi:portal protein [Nocardia sp. 852002-20019_SCH5090214]|uniref:phage portal protein n=1 Tax=Nocardia sp. 852002-20019_SCH5090214 TaxID=1834087 RepID=UPI0007EAE07C|nr:phage portal protein [Nocardia sp. 852002-20019_SCH5090214]OBA62195.1 portal protein [Nocardia sp. 852002-20019_SCH5090214]
MIDTTLTLPDLSDDENATLNRLLKQLNQRMTRNLLRSLYYDGKRQARQVSTVIPPQYNNLGIVLGWSAKAVDMLARRCNLDGFVWPDGDIDQLGLRQVWDDNFFAAESSSAVISSLIHGVSFLVNTEGDTTVGEPKSLIHVKDALSATGEWNSRTRRLDNLLSVTDRDEQGNPKGLALYLDGVTLTAVRDGAKWAVDRQEHPWGVPAEPLVYKPRAGRAFGYSRISRTVMSLHDAALRTVVRLEGQSDVFSIPELILLGADESVFKNPDGTPKSEWVARLGRIKGIPDDEEAPESLARADIRQFQAASPQPHLDTLKQQAQLFSGETSIPLSSLGVSDMTNPTSADSYVASREDLIAEAEGATDDWAPAMRRAMTRALAIAHDEKTIPKEWATVDTKWRSPLYLSRSAEADAGTKQLSAAPWLAETEVGLELLGLDEQQIRRAMAEKRRATVSQLMQRLTPPNQQSTTAPDASQVSANDGLAG